MSHLSGKFPFNKVGFHHGYPVPDSEFHTWIMQQVKVGGPDGHPLNIDVDFELSDSSLHFQRLALYGHNPLHMSRMLQSIARRRDRNLLKSQQEGIARFEHLKSRITYDTVLEDGSLMNEIYDIFSEIFFNGTLRYLCKVEFDPEELSRCWGYCISPHNDPSGRQYIPDNVASLIRLHKLGQNPNFQDPTKRLRQYTDTLLHEMLHAFLGIYTCMGGADCPSKIACEERFKEAIGFSGHRGQWQEAALEMEIAAPAFLGQEFYMNRDASLREEGEEYIASLSRETLDDWGFDEYGREIRK